MKIVIVPIKINGYLSEDVEFTTSSSGRRLEDTFGKEGEKSMIVALAAKDEGQKHVNELSDEGLHRLNKLLYENSLQLIEEGHVKIEWMLHEVDLVCWSSYDLRIVWIHAKHTAALKKEKSISHGPWDPPFKYNWIVEEEVKNITETGFIVPAALAWQLPVVPAARKDRKPELSFGYWFLTQDTKTDCTSSLYIGALFDSWSTCRVFTILDLLSRYWLAIMFHVCRQ